MLALWEIALSSLSSWLFKRRYLFLKQDSWGVGEKNMINSRGRQTYSFLKSKTTCLHGLQDSAVGFLLSSSLQLFTLLSTIARSQARPTSCPFISLLQNLPSFNTDQLRDACSLLTCSGSYGLFCEYLLPDGTRFWKSQQPFALKSAEIQQTFSQLPTVSLCHIVTTLLISNKPQLESRNCKKYSVIRVFYYSEQIVQSGNI